MEDDKKIRGKKNLLYCVLTMIFFGILLFPIYWIFVTSLKTEQEIYIQKKPVKVKNILVYLPEPMIKDQVAIWKQ